MQRLEALMQGAEFVDQNFQVFRVAGGFLARQFRLHLSVAI
jgi:hypothetical protein